MAIQTFTAAQVLTAAQMNALQANDYNQTVSTKTASYTLVAADKGTRVVMNSASATTITVNTSLFSAGDTLFLQNISTGVCTVTAGTATVSTAGSLAIPQNGSGILYFTSAGVSIFYPSAGAATTPGLVCVKAETAFSAAASITADNVFTSSYTNYRIIIRFEGTTGSDFLMLFRAATVDTATGYNFQRLQSASTTNSGAQFTSQTSATISDNALGVINLVTLEISGPQLAAPTLYQSSNARNAAAYTAPQLLFYFGNQSASTQFDGIKFTGSSGTFTGTYAIYGYSKTV